MQALVNLMLGRRQEIPPPVFLGGDWFPYISKLTAELSRHLQRLDFVEDERGHSDYHHKLVSILVTEMYRRTGVLVHQDHIFDLQKSCERFPNYLTKFSIGLQIIEARLMAGHKLYTGYTLDPSKF